MTEQQLETGKVILELIKVTEKALDNLKGWMEKTKASAEPKSTIEYGRDSNYCLSISANLNGGWPGMNLYRRTGNTALLEVLKAELERQLAQFRKDFDSL
jgi:hypothetical protein